MAILSRPQCVSCPDCICRYEGKISPYNLPNLSICPSSVSINCPIPVSYIFWTKYNELNFYTRIFAVVKNILQGYFIYPPFIFVYWQHAPGLIKDQKRYWHMWSKPLWSRINHTNTYLITAMKNINRQASNIRRTLIGNQIVDHSDVFGATPVGAAPTISSFST